MIFYSFCLIIVIIPIDAQLEDLLQYDFQKHVYCLSWKFYQEVQFQFLSQLSPMSVQFYCVNAHPPFQDQVHFFQHCH